MFNGSLIKNDSHQVIKLSSLKPLKRALSSGAAVTADGAEQFARASGCQLRLIVLFHQERHLRWGIRHYE
jgi:hypothetical protein